jgi:hypothetical protein
MTMVDSRAKNQCPMAEYIKKIQSTMVASHTELNLTSSIHTIHGGLKK